MAQLDGSITGKLRGSIGDLVFRQRNGNVFVSQRPKSFMPGTDENSVQRRSKFAFSTKLSKAIYSIPELAALWRQAAPQGRSVFHSILQTNIHLVNPGMVGALTTITPPQSRAWPGSNFAIDSTSSSNSTNAVTAEFATLGGLTGIQINIEQNVKLACVLCLTNPVDKSLPVYQFISCISESVQLILDSPLTFNIALVGENGVKVRGYRDKKLLCAMVTLDSENKPVRYSGTLVK
ncbi:MAG: hypothetical protein ACLP05_02945 [Candidatus Kryptoniota bacterium]